MKLFGRTSFAFATALLGVVTATAQSTNTASLAYPTPDVGASLIRVFGAFLLVIALFLGGVWLFRNWQRLATRRGGAPKLNVLETRALGGRQAIYVVAYEQERFLVASSPAGVNLLSHLPPSEDTETGVANGGPRPSFAQAFTQVLKGK